MTFRVYEVAEDLGVDSKQLIHMLHEMDVRVRSHMSSVSEDQIARLHARLERERRTGGHASADAASSARRRRRRKAPEVTEVVPVDDGTGEEADDEVGADEAQPVTLAAEF
ncbi:MAG: translation initiation factor IF-2 N-terminal domain-containing protein, partial [Gemmatimonadetes bacterium]|nr:translation initiation factor IF-2 N-terminal domain-containing protein [Gemmatimonadota bacterium]